MHPVGKIHRGSAHGQIDDTALRGKDIQGVVEGRFAVMRLPVTAIADILTPVQQLAQQRNFVVVVARAGRAFLVTPVGGDTQLGMLMHVVRPDLDFQGAAIFTAYRGV